MSEEMKQVQAEEALPMERAKAIITLVITTCVTIANMYGFAIDAEEWVNVALSILNAIALLYTWWKNQNITVEAVRGQHVLDSLKAMRKAA